MSRVTSTSDYAPDKPICPYGDACYRTHNMDHMDMYLHVGEGIGSKKEEEEKQEDDNNTASGGVRRSRRTSSIISSSHHPNPRADAPVFTSTTRRPSARDRTRHVKKEDEEKHDKSETKPRVKQEQEQEQEHPHTPTDTDTDTERKGQGQGRGYTTSVKREKKQVHEAKEDPDSDEDVNAPLFASFKRRKRDTSTTSASTSISSRGTKRNRAKEKEEEEEEEEEKEKEQKDEKKRKPSKKTPAKKKSKTTTSTTGGPGRIVINRAPVLALWATLVAMRVNDISFEEAATMGRAITGMFAQAKGKSIGLFESAPRKTPGQRAKTLGEHHMVNVMGRHIPCRDTEDGTVALSKGKPIPSASAVAYLKRAFGDNLSRVGSAMETLIAAYDTTDELDRRAYDDYVEFRPASGDWGAKGELHVNTILEMAKTRRA